MLSIENLTRAEKLQMMEALWDDLARDSVTLSSPEWHAQALKEAEQAVADNRAGFVSWEAAKKTLRASGRRSPPQSLAGIGEENGDIFSSVRTNVWEVLS